MDSTWPCKLRLEQTPYLNLLTPDKVRETMGVLNLPQDSKVTADVAGRVCERTQSRAVIAGSIRDVGNRYRVALRAIDCGTGRPLADVSNIAENRDEVVRVLGATAFQLRARLGEPKRSLAEFNEPLEGATSSSPDALHFFAQAYENHFRGGNLRAAILGYDQAIEKDPSLALAYYVKAVAYWVLGDRASARTAAQTAFEARNRLTVPFRFQVEILMDVIVRQRWDEGCAVAEPWVKTFPHDWNARLNYSACLEHLGRFDDALVQSREEARLAPKGPMFENWMDDAVRTDRLSEAETAFKDAVRLKVDSTRLHQLHTISAYVRGDSATLQKEWQWALEDPDNRLRVLFLQPLFEADDGHFRNARRLYRRYLDVARKAGALRTVPTQEIVEAYDDVEVGYSADSEKLAEEVLTLDPQDSDMNNAAMIFARAGNVDGAEELLQTISQRQTEGQIFRNFCVPAVEAAIKLRRNDPAAAVESLRPIEPDEFTASACYGQLYEAYLRGLAYSRLNDGHSAALQFQKLIDHPGIVQASIVGRLVYLQIARAEMLMGDQDAARKSYEEFLNMWKDADPDVPIYREAKAEYARLAGKRYLP